MSIFKGALHKMHSQLAQPVQYRLKSDTDDLLMDSLLGQKLRLTFHGGINCIHCGRKTKKSFSQGYCYPCFRSLAQCDICIVSPEKCHFEQGTCREPDWAEQHCMQDHIIYLSNTSGVKVGITRHNQIPTRWIDQGAVQALPILKVTQRYYSGLIETVFKQYLNDKTNWRSMLKNDYVEQDLQAVFDEVWPKVSAQLDAKLLADVTVLAPAEEVVAISYPAHQYPTKVTSYNLDKNPFLEDKLMAIKGQYLIFEQGVINIRKYAGYDVSIDVI